MSFIYLVLAIVAEVSGTTCMKLSHGFTRFIPSVLLFVFYGCSFTLMTLALKKLEVSVVYADWIHRFQGRDYDIEADINRPDHCGCAWLEPWDDRRTLIAGGTPALDGLHSISASCTAFVRSRG